MEFGLVASVAMDCELTGEVRVWLSGQW